MFKNKFSKLVWVLLCTFALPASAQLKYEKESRLAVEEVPEQARNFIKAITTSKKVKWYLEEGLDRSSIEAKFEYKDHNYSIEFDSIGTLEDVEVQLKWSEIAPTTREGITQYLANECKKHKVRRIQVQYTGEPSTLLQKIVMGTTTFKYTTRFELVVKCRTSENVALFEYLFNDQGQKLSASKIVFKNSSHLEY
ncbi:hypothetical protein GCM10011414_13220 [Croceivirga lutea]|uniref:hypothetical protein n=1 Tax=Croceivirga lutea TaxID=1775167 RepID=UPI00163A468F|nr:hypothetical protein [Croceivirga lutea]GGG45025.1 hypothetical protein GCM10011414_13220 [Croceivirga lutea]